MTPDQLHQVVVELGGLAAAVFANVKFKKRISTTQCEVEEGQVTRLEAEGQLTREELRATRDEMVRTKDQIAILTKSYEQMQREMHALTGRVDASNSLYTEILQKAKDREAKAAASQSVTEAGKKPDLQDQTKITVKKEEKPK